eukprot:gene5059-8654_t
MFLVVDKSKNQLRLSNFQKLTKKNYYFIFDRIEKYNITELSISKTNFSQIGIELFSKLLETNKTIQKLNLPSNKIDDFGVKCISNALKKNRVITQLNLSNNEFGKLGSEAIGSMLEENKSLKFLELEHSNAACINELGEGLTKNETLTTISYYSSPTKVELLLLSFLEDNIGLKNLNLGNTEIGSLQLICFERFFEFNQTLEFIDLKENALSDNFIKDICLGLMKNYSLKKLNLELNCFQETGCRMISEVLKTNKTLESINLSYNNINDSRIEKYFAPALKENSTLTELILRGNYIDDEGFYNLCDSLENHSSLNLLDVDSNLIRKAGMEHLSNLMRKNNVIEVMIIGSGEFDDEVYINCFDALMYNYSLIHTQLDIDDWVSENKRLHKFYHSKRIEYENRNKVVKSIARNFHIQNSWKKNLDLKFKFRSR